MLLAFASSGVIVAWFVTRMNREIAKQARMIDDLRKSEDEQRRLASLASLTAGVTHELATPLATLSLISEDLVRGKSNYPLLSEDIALLHGEVARCGEILSRLRASSSELQGEPPRRFLVSELLVEISTEFSSSRLVVSCADPNTCNLELYTLRNGLLESLRALIRNALQACLESGERSGGVELFIASKEGRIAFRVIDSGCGIPSELLERIGDPFFTSKAPGQGLGLGVYLTKLFARQVGGELKFSSELAVGSEFVLEIPNEVVL
jgi:two-component system sensor histidine kinase RegB